MVKMRTPAAALGSGERGFTLLDILFVVAVIGVLASLAVPGLTRARATAGEASALGTLRVINSGQLSYAITCGAGFYAPDLMTLGTPPPGTTVAFVPDDLGSANAITKSNYLFQMSGTPLGVAPPSCNGLGVGNGATGYRLGADPLDPAAQWFFATNATGTIYRDGVSLYAAMPEAAQPAQGQPID